MRRPPSSHPFHTMTPTYRDDLQPDLHRGGVVRQVLQQHLHHLLQTVGRHDVPVLRQRPAHTLRTRAADGGQIRVGISAGKSSLRHLPVETGFTGKNGRNFQKLKKHSPLLLHHMFCFDHMFKFPIIMCMYCNKPVRKSKELCGVT